MEVEVPTYVYVHITCILVTFPCKRIYVAIAVTYVHGCMYTYVLYSNMHAHWLATKTCARSTPLLSALLYIGIGFYTHTTDILYDCIVIQYIVTVFSTTTYNTYVCMHICLVALHKCMLSLSAAAIISQQKGD